MEKNFNSETRNQTFYHSLTPFINEINYIWDDKFSLINHLLISANEHHRQNKHHHSHSQVAIYLEQEEPELQEKGTDQPEIHNGDRIWCDDKRRHDHFLRRHGRQSPLFFI